MTLMRLRMLSEVPTLREAIDRLFDDSFVSPREWFATARFDTPAIDAYTTPEAFVVKAAMPGIKREEIQPRSPVTCSRWRASSARSRSTKIRATCIAS